MGHGYVNLPKGMSPQRFGALPFRNGSSLRCSSGLGHLMDSCISLEHRSTECKCWGRQALQGYCCNIKWITAIVYIYIHICITLQLILSIFWDSYLSPCSFWWLALRHVFQHEVSARPTKAGSPSKISQRAAMGVPVSARGSWWREFLVYNSFLIQEKLGSNHQISWKMTFWWVQQQFY